MAVQIGMLGNCPARRVVDGQHPNVNHGPYDMNLQRLLLAAAATSVAGLSLVSMPVARAADTGLGGNPVPGVCMLSREAVFANSKVGHAATQRLQQLAQQANAQLGNQRKPLDTDIKTFQSQAQTLSDTQRKQQGQALRQRMQSFDTQAGQMNERLRLTRAKAMQRIGTEAQPIVASAYATHHCGLLLNRDAVLGGNTTNDLTPEVIDGLDHKITTISFELEPLPAKSSGQ